MNSIESEELFEVEEGLFWENSSQARLVCVKDFFKKCALFPFTLLLKVLKTMGRAVAVCFGAAVVLITLGSSPTARSFFVERTAILAKDLVDWALLPLALLTRVMRLLMALLVHPRFYFNSL